VSPADVLRGLLHNAASRQHVQRRAPQARDAVEWFVGYDEGRTEGTLEALAFALAVVTGESVGDLIHDARAQATMDAEFPFTLWTEVA
jgi:hypothetical protein